MLLCIGFFGANVKAQICSTYSFTTSTGATLQDMTSATQILNSGNDDSPSTVQNIGFNFVYEGITYTQFSCTPDGFLKLGGVAAVAQFSNSITSTTNIPKIFPWWDDLATGTNGNVKFIVTGVSPNQICAIQWFVTAPRATGGTANTTFQVWLYETTNVIEFRYGSGGTSSSASVGINGTTATNFESVTVSANTMSIATANNLNTTCPASGRIYTFSPPAQCNTQPLAGTATSSSSCLFGSSNVNLNLTSNTAGLGITYQWQVSTNGGLSFANVGSVLTSPPLTTAVVAGNTYIFQCITTCTNTSQSNTSSTVTVNVNPVAFVTPNNTKICTGGSTLLTAPANATSYTWSANAGSVTTQTATVNATGTYSCTVVFGSCSTTISATVGSATDPTISGSVSPTTVCAGDLVTVSSTATYTSSYKAEPITYNAQSMAGSTVLCNAGVNNFPQGNITYPYNSTTLDDGVWQNIPLGFTFNFYGVDYTTVNISTNGNLQFGGGTSTAFTGVTIPTTGIPNNMIAAHWVDLLATVSGKYEFVSTGSQFMVNWAAPVFSGTDLDTFQVILYAGTNVIETHIKAFTNNAAKVFTIGVENADGTSGTGVTGRNTSNATIASNEAWRFTPSAAVYSWTGGLFTASVANPPSFASVVGNSGTFSVNLSDGYGCSVNSTTATLTVNPVTLFYTDVDGDGYDAGSGTQCWDGINVPTGFSLNTLGTDCNDSDPTVYISSLLYIDNDNDGYDNGQSTQCWNGITAPLGYSTTTLGTDCNDSDPTVYISSLLYVDNDGDGYDNGQSTQCWNGITAPLGYSTTTLGTDCNDSDPSLTTNVVYYQDNDGDGYGSAVTTSQCTNTTPGGYANVGGDCNDGNGNINPHGAPNSVSVSLVAAHNATIVWADGSCGNGTSFQLRRRVVGTLPWTYVGSPMTTPSRTLVNLLAYTQYEVQLRTRFGTDSSVWTSSTLFTTLCDGPTSAGASNLTTTTATINWTGGLGAHIVQYRENAPHTSWIRINVPSGQSSLVITGLTPGSTYVYRVATRCGGGINSAFTPNALFTLPLIRMENPSSISTSPVAEINAIISPNPSEGIFNINGDVNFTGNLTISIVDVTGRVIDSRILSVDGLDFSESFDLTSAPAGMYIAYISGEDESLVTLRLIKQ